jgi:hypothetical protein
MKNLKIYFLIAFATIFLTSKLNAAVITGFDFNTYGATYAHGSTFTIDFNLDSFNDLTISTDNSFSISMTGQNGSSSEVDASNYIVKLSMGAIMGNQNWTTSQHSLVDGVLGNWVSNGLGYACFKLQNGCLGWIQLQCNSDMSFYVGYWAYSDVVGQNLKAGATSLSGIEDILYSNISFISNNKNITMKNIPDGKGITLKVFNSIGELILSQDVKQTNEEIPLIGLLNGNYIAILENKSELILSRKIVISN